MVPSKYLYYELTRACNERCVQCFNSSGRRLSGELDVEVAIDLIRRFRSMGGVDLQLTGGEVFSKRGIDELVSEVGGIGFERVTLSTNGTLLNDRRLDAIQAHVDECDVSLDGFADTHDVLRGMISFDKTLRAVNQLAQLSNVRVHVCTCISRPLLPRIREFLDLLISIEVDSVKLALIEDIGRSATQRDWMLPREKYKELYWQFEELRSEYGSQIMIEQSLSLTPVLPCVEVDGLVCDPRGRLYPLIGFLPDYWVVGRAHPQFEMEATRLGEYKDEAERAVMSAIDRVAEGNPVNWWHVIHRHLDAVAHSKSAR